MNHINIMPAIYASHFCVYAYTSEKIEYLQSTAVDNNELLQHLYSAIFHKYVFTCAFQNILPVLYYYTTDTYLCALIRYAVKIIISSFYEANPVWGLFQIRPLRSS